MISTSLSTSPREGYRIYLTRIYCPGQQCSCFQPLITRKSVNEEIGKGITVPVRAEPWRSSI